MKIFIIIACSITFFTCKETPQKVESNHENKTTSQSKIAISEKIFEISYCDTISNSIGVVKIKKELFAKGDKIDIFNLDGSVYRSVSFEDEKSILTYKCNGNKDKKCFIQVGEDEKYVFDNNKFISLHSWEEHLLNNVFSIDFNFEENPIRKSINGEILITEKSNNRRITPFEIKDNWLKIKYLDFNSNTTIEGWIKWRNEKCLFVELLYFA